MTVQASPLSFTLRSQTARGQRVPLAPDGALILARSGELPVTGSGLQPGSRVTQSLYSSPVELGSVVVTADEKFAAAPDIPTTVSLGSHTLVLRGTTKTGEPFELSIGVIVRTPVAALGSNPALSVSRGSRSGEVMAAIRGAQAQCVVTFDAGGAPRRVRASAAGDAQALVKTVHSGRSAVSVTATVGGKGCARVVVRRSWKP